MPAGNNRVTRLAYFEWSATADPGPEPPAAADDHPAWEAAHRQALIESNPAFGIRITEEGCATERVGTPHEDYARERLSIFPTDITATESAFDPDDWTACLLPTSKTTGKLAVAFEVSLDRKWSQVGIAGQSLDGAVHVGITDNRPGTGWVIARLLELQAELDPSAIVCNPAGPAGGLLPEAEKAGLVVGLPDPDTGTVKALTGTDYRQACQSAYDAIVEHRWRHLGQGVLDVAIANATKRTVGDAFVFDRRGVTDISPLITVTLAAWAHGRQAKVTPPSTYEERGLTVL